MTDTLRERVAEELWQASSIRAVGQRRVITWEDAGPPTWNQWYPLADAAIALVLEEAAKEAECVVSYSTSQAVMRENIAAAIRALKDARRAKAGEGN